ncbi:MAG: hypothetical protein WDN50_23405 [Bradyrhizobium sp.]
MLTVLLAGLPADSGAGLAALFLSGLRAEAMGAGFARTGMDDFDFAAIFLDLATALAMTCKHPREGKEVRALHHFGRSAQGAKPAPKADKD